MNQPKASVTIRDVAFAASVSVSTVSRVLNDRVDVSPETAAVVRRVIQELGYASSIAARRLCIPNDLSVVGFDNTLESNSVNPLLTTVDQSIEAMGALAADIVLKLIQGQPWESRLNKVPTRLVVRQSCRHLAPQS